MKYLIFIFLLFTACRDQYAPEFNHYDASQVEGFWHGEGHPVWYWHFSDGLLNKSIWDFNIPFLVEQYYAYNTRRDTIFLQDLIGHNDTVFTVYFETDSTATLTDETDTLHLQYKIKRF